METTDELLLSKWLCEKDDKQIEEVISNQLELELPKRPRAVGNLDFKALQNWCATLEELFGSLLKLTRQENKTTRQIQWERLLLFLEPPGGYRIDCNEKG